MLAQSLYSQKELLRKSTNELQEMCFQKGYNFNDCPDGFKRGRVILKEKEELVKIPQTGKEISRLRWASFEPPVFARKKEFLDSRIPKIES